MKFLTKMADLIFPRYCVDCGEKLQNDSFHHLCLNCASQLESIITNSEAKCDLCQTPVLSHSVKVCYSCSTIPSDFENSRSFFYYRQTAIRELVHLFKFQSQKTAGDDLAKLCSPFLKTLLPSTDLIIPVPLSPLSLKKRGFNQVCYLLKKLNIPYQENILTRKNHRKAQSQLSREQRLKSVSSQFSISLNAEHLLKDRTILLVDDIYTTGSTARAISSLLRQNGAEKIFILTFFRD